MKKTKKQEKKEAKKKSKNTPKLAFQLPINFSIFLAGFSTFPFFDTLAQKARTQKSTIKIGVSGSFFWKADVRHETDIFGPQKTSIYKFQLSFFGPIFFSFNNKKPQNLLKPLFL